MKPEIRIGDGYVSVRMDMIPDDLRKRLQYWKSSIGRWQPGKGRAVERQLTKLFREEKTVLKDGSCVSQLTTLPGFAYRVMQFFQDEGWETSVFDLRTRIPPIQWEAAMQGLRPYQVEIVYKALMSGGGIVAASTGCLAEGTPVRLADGTIKPVEEIKAGDRLLAFDDNTNMLTSSVVESMIRTDPNHKPKPMMEINIDNEKTVVTYDHPFFAGDGFYPLYQLVWGALEERQRTQLKLLCKQYGATLDDQTPWRQRSSSNETRFGRVGVLSHCTGWAYNKGSQDCCGKLAGEPTWAADSEPYKLCSFRQSSREPGMVLDKVQCVVWGNPWANQSVPASSTRFADTNRTGRACKTVSGKVEADLASVFTESSVGHIVSGTAERISTSTENSNIIASKVRVRMLVKIKRAAPYYTIRMREAPYTYCIGRKHCYLTHNCGKTCMAAAIIRAFSRNDMANRGTPLFVMTCTDKDIARKNWQDLKGWLPDRSVGLIMSGVNQPSTDVQVITTDSLHRLDPNDIGLMIVDEVHTVATEARSAKILAASKAIKWGLSATPTGRFDGGDILTEGLVGPVVCQFSYEDGVRTGALVPITVYWVESPEPDGGLQWFSALKTRDACYRHGVVRSRVQNGLAVEILKRIPTEMQSLCIMQQTEQMNRIVGMYPGIRYIHAKTTDSELSDVGQNNLLGITASERKQIYDDFASGKIRQILSTAVYKQGVNFPDLQVIVCPGGGGSDIAAGQIPGRGSRKIDGKDHAYLIDFWHPWDIRLNTKGKAVSGFILHDDEKRRAKYKELGFEQIRVKDISEIPFLRT